MDREEQMRALVQSRPAAANDPVVREVVWGIIDLTHDSESEEQIIDLVSESESEVDMVSESDAEDARQPGKKQPKVTSSEQLMIVFADGTKRLVTTTETKSKFAFTFGLSGVMYVVKFTNKLDLVAHHRLNVADVLEGRRTVVPLLTSIGAAQIVDIYGSSKLKNNSVPEENFWKLMLYVGPEIGFRQLEPNEVPNHPDLLAAAKARVLRIVPELEGKIDWFKSDNLFQSVATGEYLMFDFDGKI